MSDWAEELARKAQEKQAPEDVEREDMYGLLLRMLNRHGEGKAPLLTDEEVETILMKDLLDSIINSVEDELYRRYGSGGSSESANANPEVNLINELRRKSDAVQESYGMLFVWFFNHCDNQGEPIWAKALEYALDQPREARASAARGHLLTSGERELSKVHNIGSGGALLDSSVRRALNHWKDIFEPLDVGSGSGRQSCSFGLKGRHQWVVADMDVEAFARTLVHRTVRPQRGSTASDQTKTLTQRERVIDIIPYPAEIKDLLRAAMEKEGCGFTLAQAKTLVRTVYDLSIQGMESLDENSDTERFGAQGADLAESEAGTGYERSDEAPIEAMTIEQAAPIATSPIEDESDRMIRAMEAVIAEIQRLDGMSPDNRPEDTKKGRQARYLLDFEIWDDSQLLPGEETERLRKAVQLKYGTQPRNCYSQVYFEAWSGISNSTVSTWQGPKVKPDKPPPPPPPRARLLAVGASVFFGWAKEQAELEMTLGTSRRAWYFQTRLYLLLRRRFPHRKPEFVSGDSFAQTGIENTDS